MPQTHEIETFTFDELNEDAKDKVRDWYRKGFSDISVSAVTDMFTTELQERGLHGLAQKDRSPQWSLGHVQGDGVSFDGTIDLSGIKPIEGDEGHGDQAADEKHVAEIKKLMMGIDPDFLSVTVTASNQFMSFDVEVEQHPDEDASHELTEDEGLALGKAITEWLIDLSRRFARMGYEELEYQESDDQIKETCEANEYLFDATGTPVHHLIGKEKCEHGIAKPWYCAKCERKRKQEARKNS